MTNSKNAHRTKPARTIISSPLLAKYSDPSRCPGCMTATPAAIATLNEGKINDVLVEAVFALPDGKLVCAECHDWELNTGLAFMPCAGPGPMQCVALEGPTWRPFAHKDKIATPTIPADDGTAFRPASEFIDPDHFPTFKAINKALIENAWIRKRRPNSRIGKPIMNRLEIHAGDWHEFKNKHQALDPMDLPAHIVDTVLEKEKRKSQFRKQRENTGK